MLLSGIAQSKRRRSRLLNPEQNEGKQKGHLYRCPFMLISSFLSSRAASSQVLSAFVSLTTVFGMGTGVSSQLSPLNR